jgi:IclR family KDG regulon transcriptional repressor
MNVERAAKSARSAAPAKSRQSAKSVNRVLDVLDYLDSCHSEAGVTEIGKALGVHKSTASRLLSTMETRGYVNRNDITGKYSLGIRLLELSRTKLEQLDLRFRARPFLEELVNKTNETAHLAVLNQGSVVYIDKIDTPQTLMMRSRIGYRIAAHCTALGKAILARLPSEIVDSILADNGMARFTPNTITDIPTFKEHLRRVKNQGFAIDDEEHEEGIRCAAGAILDYTGSVAGAISVSGPSIRISRQRLDEIGRVVRDVSRRLSSSLGYNAHTDDSLGRE